MNYKSLFVFIALLSTRLIVGQNPHLGGIDLTPDNSPGRSPGIFNCGQAMVSTFNFSVDGTTPPVYAANCGLSFTISIVGWQFQNTSDAASNITSSPDINNLFTFAFGTNSIIATQIGDIPTSPGDNPISPFPRPVFTVALVVPITADLGQTLAITINLQVPQACGNADPGDDTESTNASVYCDGILPIQKFELNVLIINNTTSKITWNTLNEKNSHAFEIERKIGQILSWTKIASLPAAGISTTEKKYDFIDNFNKTNERIYYRIKQIDLDGTFNYTDIKSIQINPGSLQIDGFPNPIINQYSLQIHSKNEDRISLEIVDILGRIISKEDLNINSGTYSKKLQFGSLPAGTYIIKVIGQRNSGLLTVVKVDG